MSIDCDRQTDRHRPRCGGTVGMTGPSGRVTAGSQAPANTSSMWLRRYLNIQHQSTVNHSVTVMSCDSSANSSAGKWVS